MRLRHIKGAEDIVDNSIFLIHPKKNSTNEYIEFNLSTIFKNALPIALELGMGKGQFICEMAKENKNYNFIGIEKYATIIIKAIENYKKIYLEKDKSLSDDIFFNDILNSNLKFLYCDVLNLKQLFYQNSIDKIFLNFSDPWPKKRHELRRLTSKTFLPIYDYLLKINGYIEFKTDNINLFDFSLNEIKNYGFKIINYTYDLHNNDELNKNNIMTEYEYKFSKKGNKICKLTAKKIK